MNIKKVKSEFCSECKKPFGVVKFFAVCLWNDTSNAVSLDDTKWREVCDTCYPILIKKLITKEDKKIMPKNLSKEVFITNNPKDYEPETVRLLYSMQDVPEYADQMTLQEWKDNVRCGMFIDYDGFGKLATKTKESMIEIRPSRLTLQKDYEFPKWVTHICWYNR